MRFMRKITPGFPGLLVAGGLGLALLAGLPGAGFAEEAGPAAEGDSDAAFLELGAPLDLSSEADGMRALGEDDDPVFTAPPSDVSLEQFDFGAGIHDGSLVRPGTDPTHYITNPRGPVIDLAIPKVPVSTGKF